MAAVTTDQLIDKKVADRLGGPVAAATVLYNGTMAFISATGFATGVTASGANKFAGIVRGHFDNAAGADGDVQADWDAEGAFILPGTGFTQADVGALVYATDNYTVTKTATSNVFVGQIVEFISATAVRVKLLQKTA